jgi:hypothetical protein
VLLFSRVVGVQVELPKNARPIPAKRPGADENRTLMAADGAFFGGQFPLPTHSHRRVLLGAVASMNRKFREYGDIPIGSRVHFMLVPVGARSTFAFRCEAFRPCLKGTESALNEMASADVGGEDDEDNSGSEVGGGDNADSTTAAGGAEQADTSEQRTKRGSFWSRLRGRGSDGASGAEEKGSDGDKVGGAEDQLGGATEENVFPPPVLTLEFFDQQRRPGYEPVANNDQVKEEVERFLEHRWQLLQKL